jgi:hypothetical protein
LLLADDLAAYSPFSLRLIWRVSPAIQISWQQTKFPYPLSSMPRKTVVFRSTAPTLCAPCRRKSTSFTIHEKWLIEQAQTVTGNSNIYLDQEKTCYFLFFTLHISKGQTVII